MFRLHICHEIHLHVQNIFPFITIFV